MVVGGPLLATHEPSVRGGGNVRRALCRKAPSSGHHRSRLSLGCLSRGITDWRTEEGHIMGGSLVGVGSAANHLLHWQGLSRNG